MQRLDRLGIPPEALPDLLDTTELTIRKWVSGVLSPEEADVVEVAVSMLEFRLARVVARRCESERPITAVA